MIIKEILPMCESITWLLPFFSGEVKVVATAAAAAAERKMEGGRV